MTREKAVEGWKVRVALPGAVLHFVSSTEPKVTHSDSGVLAGIDWTPTAAGDIPGFIEWSAVIAVTWRQGATS